VTPNLFDNKYYGNLLHGRTQLESDQVWGHAVGPSCGSDHCTHCSPIHEQPDGFLQELQGVHD
jgi:hypothetical protein